MHNKYYYLLSSLPYLVFEIKKQITREDFLNESEKWLSKKDIATLKNINFNNLTHEEKDPDILKEWKNFNTFLKEEIKTMRMAQKTHSKELLSENLKAIYEEKNPLLMEKRFEKTRWDFIEQKEFSYNFDINSLILYFLKLQILERLLAFNKVEGAKIFEELSEVHPHTYFTE
jgi:hypothetical protein